MDILRWLARSAARLRWRSAGGKSASDTDQKTDKERARVARALRTRLSSHLMRDIGLGDRDVDDG